MRLLVAGVERGDVKELARERVYLRLGDDAYRLGRISAGKLEQTREVAERFARVARKAAVERLETIVTAPGRQAENGDELVQVLAKATRAPVVVLERRGRRASCLAGSREPNERPTGFGRGRGSRRRLVRDRRRQPGERADLGAVQRCRGAASHPRVPARTSPVEARRALRAASRSSVCSKTSVHPAPTRHSPSAVRHERSAASSAGASARTSSRSSRRQSSGRARRRSSRAPASRATGPRLCSAGRSVLAEVARLLGTQARGRPRRAPRGRGARARARSGRGRLSASASELAEDLRGGAPAHLRATSNRSPSEAQTGDAALLELDRGSVRVARERKRRELRQVRLVPDEGEQRLRPRGGELERRGPSSTARAQERPPAPASRPPPRGSRPSARPSRTSSRARPRPRPRSARARARPAGRARRPRARADAARRRATVRGCAARRSHGARGRDPPARIVGTQPLTPRAPAGCDVEQARAIGRRARRDGGEAVPPAAEDRRRASGSDRGARRPTRRPSRTRSRRRRPTRGPPDGCTRVPSGEAREAGGARPVSSHGVRARAAPRRRARAPFRADATVWRQRTSGLETMRSIE